MSDLCPHFSHDVSSGVSCKAPGVQARSETGPATAEDSAPSPEARAHGPYTAVFMGTPDFAAHILERVLDCPAVRVTAAYTQPDRPSGRGHKQTPPPVKQLAQERGIPVFQPLNFKAPEAVDELAALEPDFLLVAAYGLILPQAVLDIPRLMPLNVHASLLPKLRGAAPIQRAIMQGGTVTGISIMRMEAGLDTGPVLLQKALSIGVDDTAATLHDQLADLGGRLLCECLERLHSGAALPLIEQDERLATYAPKLSKADSAVNWNSAAWAVHAHIRGVSPWPGARAVLTRPDGSTLALALAPGSVGELLPSENPPLPGTIMGLSGNALAVACQDRAYLVPAVQPQGKAFMDSRSFVNGYLKGTAEGSRIS